MLEYHVISIHQDFTLSSLTLLQLVLAVVKEALMNAPFAICWK